MDVGESRSMKLATNFTPTSRVMKSIPISEIKLARSERDLVNLKETGNVGGGSPATTYRAQIMLPCQEDQPVRHQETRAEIPVKYRANVIKGQPPQIYLRSLPDCKYRKWTCSNRTILREWGTMVAFRETIAASREEWEELIKDQWNEIKDEPWLAEDSFTTGLGIYSFLLSVLHAEILERICEFPPVTHELRAQEMLTGKAARTRDAAALEELKQLMQVLVTKKDPRTNVTHWLFRKIPRLILNTQCSPDGSLV